MNKNLAPHLRSVFTLTSNLFCSYLLHVLLIHMNHVNAHVY